MGLAFSAVWAPLLSARPALQPGAALSVLDVPFLPQTPDLCGGAAAAMVLRFWGERASPDEFAPLLDLRSRGIPAAALADAVRQRGLAATVFRADAGEVRRQLARGRPVIGLIGAGQGRLHYVVIVAWTSGHVLLHDPARGPFRVYRERDLFAAWRASGGWALVASKNESAAADAPAAEPASSGGGSACEVLVGQGVELARAGQAEAAETRLSAAAGLCADSAAALRELAGLRFRAALWREAASLAEAATRLEPDDTHAWRTLAASRYLAGDPERALRAFNRLGEPRLDLVRIDGLERTRFAALAKGVGLEPDELVTAARLARAQRRIRDVPALRSARASYRPTSGGRADLEVAVVERPLAPTTPSELARIAARAWSEREAELSLASPTGAGELVSVTWRFWEARPAFGLALEAPRALGMPGLLRAAARWDTQSYRSSPGSPTLRERQREVGLALSDWSSRGLKWELGSSLQRFADGGSFLGPMAALEARSSGERLAARAGGAAFFPVAGQRGRFTTYDLALAWRSSREAAAALRLRGGLSVRSQGAPLAFWAGAGTGAGRAPLLRAHPLLDDGVLVGEVFGRRLLFAGAELEPAGLPVGPLRLGLACFVDAARASERSQAGAADQVDIGVGLRLRFPGVGGAVRIDVAHGLRDGATRASAGWVRAWPGLAER